MNELQGNAQEVESLLEILYEYTKSGIGNPDVAGNILPMLEIIKTKQNNLINELETKSLRFFEKAL